jgi:hypothetical protein
MSVRIVSYEAAVKAAIQAHLAGNLEDAAAYYEGRVRDRIGVQGPPRSTPGSPPHMDTGYLRNESLSHEVDAASLTARIGSDAPYAAALEVGGTNRPFFVPTLIEESDEIARRVCKT